MQNASRSKLSSSGSCSAPVRARCVRRWLVRPVAIATVMVMGWTGRAIAQTPSGAAPAELTRTISQIDAAANQRNLRDVMRYFSRNFTHSDGLTYASLQQSLQQFWGRFPRVTYRTELTSWRREGNAILAETTTTITGVQSQGGRTFNLTATVGSRQRFENGQIVRQDVLTEQSRLTSGQNPPTLTITLPAEVGTNREFAFDAVVQEPLGRRLLLGSALSQPVRATGYTQAPDLDLELLSAGGLFKVGRTTLTPENRWISAILVRQDGITAETRRLRVVSSPATPNRPSTRPQPQNRQPANPTPQQNRRPGSGTIN